MRLSVRSSRFWRLGALLVLPAVLSLSTVIQAQEAESVILDSTDPALVTFYIHDGDVTIDRDPSLAGSVTSVRTIGNTFLGLTDLSPETGDVRPELATDWSVSEDGLTWTFTLRDDVPWVSYNPDTGEARVERMVTAQDIVTALQRSCNSTLGGSYGPVTASFVAGCQAVLDAGEPTEDVLSGLGVTAVDDTTVEFTLTSPTGFFPAVASLWTLHPVPTELIEEFGNAWIDVGNAWFSGPFLTESYTPGVGRTFIRNPFLPEDLRGPGNADRVEIVVINDNSTLLSLYQSGQVDIVRSGGIPEGELPSLLEDEAVADQLLFISGTGIDYLSFNHGKPPFDNVYVRRAFSAAINREQIIADAAGGLGSPMIHITPPSMPAAPPIDEVGVGYNPDWAREQLAQSPYPNCEGFPDVYSVSQPGRRTLYVEFLVQAWATELGCDPAKFHNETIDDFSNMVPIISINNNMEDRPEWHPIGWGPDYPDANNYVGDILKCDIDNGFTSRPCSEVDDVIAAARVETDPATREEMYAQIEDMFFGEEGVFPAAPIRLAASYGLYQTYVDGPFETDGQVGAEHYDWYTIDKEAQDAVRGS